MIHPIAARFPGTCATCKGTTFPGQPIVKHDSAWRHLTCLPRDVLAADTYDRSPNFAEFLREDTARHERKEQAGYRKW